MFSIIVSTLSLFIVRPLSILCSMLWIDCLLATSKMNKEYQFRLLEFMMPCIIGKRHPREMRKPDPKGSEETCTTFLFIHSSLFGGLFQWPLNMGQFDLI